MRIVIIQYIQANALIAWMVQAQAKSAVYPAFVFESWVYMSKLAFMTLQSSQEYLNSY